MTLTSTAMKTQLTKLPVWGLIMGLSTGIVSAQEWSFGPKAYLGLSQRRSVGDQVRINSTLVSATNDGDAVGGSVGAFARYDRLRWYLQAEATRGSYSLANAVVSNSGGGFPTYPKAFRTDIRLIAGARLLPWLRLSAGLTGAASRWKMIDYANDIRRFQEYIQKNPFQQEFYGRQIEQYQIADAIQTSYKKVNFEGQLGAGADIGGLTLDLIYAHSLTPVVDGITVQNQTYAHRQQYGYWSLGIGYKLFPLKQHVLAPRKNKAYERLKQDIPFYRNEVHVSAGLLGEDLGSQLLYENRYTRYLSRRVGLMGGLTFSHRFTGTNDQPGGPQLSNQLSLLTGIRLLPLYSRRHTIGFTAGPLLAYTDELQASSSSTTSANGQVTHYLTLNRNAAKSVLTTGWHGSLDYQFAFTDRLIAGPWLRLLGQSFLTPDYASLGIQTGYRF
ncbi:hypothetical protein GCM10028816_29720 [Spirosoma lituiforme]